MRVPLVKAWNAMSRCFSHRWMMPFFPQQRLAAGEEAGVGTQGLGLGEHPVHFLEGQALLVAIFRRPAAGAVHMQAEVGSIRISHGTLISYLAAFSCAVL